MIPLNIFLSMHITTIKIILKCKHQYNLQIKIINLQLNILQLKLF